MAAALALLSSVLWGSADFGGGLLTRRLSAYAVVGASQAAGLLAVTVAVVATGGFDADPGWLPWAVAAGAAGAVGLVCFYSALASGTMGVVSPIAALGAVVPVIVGLVEGERPSALALTGIAVALVGVVAASGPELRGDTGARPVVLAVAAGIGFGLTIVFLARGAEASALLTLWGMRATSVSAFLLAAVVLRAAGGLTARDLAPLATVGVADAGANLLLDRKSVV